MNALTVVQQPSFTVSDVERVALAIAKGGLFGSKDPNAVLTLCLLAQAEGQHPAVVFRDYHIIQGKPAKKAEAMMRDFINAGGKVEWHRLDDDCADATFTHPSGSARIEWTRERAKQAGISTPMWSKYPRQMLRSRVISEGVRTVYPGATSGLYEENEVRDFAPVQQPEAGEIIDHEAPQPNEPAPRTKLDGPHTSKTALRKAIVEIIGKVREADSGEAIDALLKEAKATISQANADWPALINGDPNIEEDIGLKGAVELKRAELAEYDGVQKMIDSMNDCETLVQLNAWTAANGDEIDGLSDPDRRRFEAERDKRESAIMTMDKVTA